MSEEVVVVKTNPAPEKVEEKTNWARLHGSWKERIERMLPDPRVIDQFMYAAEVQYGKNKQAFDKCTPVSLLNCMLTCAKYGILPDGRVAHLIPYGNECSLQFDYKGYIHVVIRDGVAKKVFCDVVCANDVFEWENGAVKKHKITFPRGPILAAYCAITLTNGEIQYELIERDELDVIKSCSRGSTSPSSPWNKFFGEMAKKSAFRRATKWIKLSPDVQDAINADDESFDFEEGQGTKAAVRTLFSKPKTEPELVEHKPSEETTKEEASVAKVQATAKKIKEKEENANQLPF